jgi:hypothetical protein
MELVGAAGTLRYEYWAEPQRFRIGADGVTETFVVPDWNERDESGYVAAFRAVAERLRMGGPPPYGLSDAYRVMWAINQVTG